MPSMATVQLRVCGGEGKSGMVKTGERLFVGRLVSVLRGDSAKRTRLRRRYKLVATVRRQVCREGAGTRGKSSFPIRGN